MRETLIRFYAIFREPKNFLVLLCLYIVGSVTAHLMRGYDSDFGLTNLVLSIEASIASAAIMMMNRDNAESIEKANAQMREMVKHLVEAESRQEKMLQGILLIAEAQRDALVSLQEKRDEPVKRKSAVQRKRTGAN